MHLAVLCRRCPSASKTTAVLWYSRWRASNSELTSTTPCCFANLPRRSVDGPRDGLGQVEFVHRFVLAEVRAVVQFLQQHSSAGAGGLGHAGFDDGEVRRGIAVVAFLHQRDGSFCTWTSTRARALGQLHGDAVQAAVLPDQRAAGHLHDFAAGNAAASTAAAASSAGSP